jgi:aspartate kinase
MTISVLKIGGSVLTDIAAYRRAAAFVAQKLAGNAGDRFVVVVSAQHGETDALLHTAQDLCPEPNREALDLLWSTGELRSVALLVLALHSLGVRATPANVHQTGLGEADPAAPPGSATFVPLRLLERLVNHDVVVVPGFLARGAGDVVVSLGRGGSDLTAVLLAAGLGARECELVKDVDGYYSADPRLDPHAHHLAQIDFPQSLAMAEAGCDVVQRTALETARTHRLPLTVRAIGSRRATLVGHECA